MTAPRLPILICRALAIARLVCPLTLLAGQDRTSATDGYMPAAAKIVPRYETPGRGSDRSRMYPRIARDDVARMKGARRWYRSDRTCHAGGEKERDGVGRDGHELCLGCGVAQRTDDGG